MTVEQKPCPKCGESNYPSDRTCLSCGAPLVAPPPPPVAVPASPANLAPPQQAAADSGFGAMIPLKNPSALTAYYLGVFSIIPCIGLVLGIAAFVLGLKGLKAVKANPAVKGTAHAWVGIICGGFWVIANIVGILWVAAGQY